jgi:translation initiation factor 1
MKEKKRVPITDEPFPWKSPFAALKHVTLPPTPTDPPVRIPANTPARAPKSNRGRVDILRSTAHRGGKTVTVVTGFAGISQSEKERLAKEMQKSCGAGGTVKEGRIEIQGDHRDAVARILTNAGFRPVFAGG